MIRISPRPSTRASLAVALLPFVACVVPRPPATPSNQPLAGTWAYVGRSTQGDSVVGTLTIVEHARGLAGAIRMNLPDTASTNIRVNVKGAEIWFAAPTRSMSSQDQFLSVVATPKADHTMTGLWNRDGRGGQWTARLIESAPK